MFITGQNSIRYLKIYDLTNEIEVIRLERRRCALLDFRFKFFFCTILTKITFKEVLHLKLEIKNNKKNSQYIFPGSCVILEI